MTKVKESFTQTWQNNMQEKFDNQYKYFYRDSYNEPRTYGIYSPVVDRFVLVSDLDLWSIFETAELLSSKIATIVYVLPYHGGEISQSNCLSYSIENKSSQKIANSSISNARQTPVLRFLYDDEALVEAGLPADFENEEHNLQELQDYAMYLLESVIASNLANVYYNQASTERFEKFFDDKEILFRKDRSDSEVGVFREIKKILYLSNSRNQAEEAIVDLWKTHCLDQPHLTIGYYKILGKPVPESLVELLSNNPVNLSLSVF